MTVLTTTEALASFCKALSDDDYIAIDTEFMRERTYYAKLCLVQIAGRKAAAAIDPLAKGMDLSPLYDLLSNPSVLKVFHAARQDVEIFTQTMGRVPAPLFDTQVAAMVCGFGDSIGYEPLASALAKAKIDKSSRFTDWAARPLSDKQIAYALNDVIPLRTVYEKLEAMLQDGGRKDWLREEMAILSDPSTYALEPQNAWKRLKHREVKPRRLAALQALAAWREEEARKADIPRSRILKDEQLVDIATHDPATAQDLTHLRGLPGGFAESRRGAAVLKALDSARTLPPEACPVAEKRRVLPHGASATLELLKVLLRALSEEKGVAAKLIASTDDLERLASEEKPDIKTLNGWRLDVFGRHALALRSGAIALTVHKGKVRWQAVSKEESSNR